MIRIGEIAILGSVVAVRVSVAIRRGFGVRGLVRLHLGEEVGGCICRVRHGHVELLLGEESIERVGRCLELGVHSACLGFAEWRGIAHLDVAPGGTRRIDLVLVKQLTLARFLRCCSSILNLSTELVSCPSCLARGLWAAWASRMADAELVGMQEHSIAVRDIELLLLTPQPVRALLYAGLQTFAHGVCEGFVFLFGDLDFVVVRVLDVVLAVLVLVLQSWLAFCEPQRSL